MSQAWCSTTPRIHFSNSTAHATVIYIFQLLSQLSAFPGLAGMGMYGLPGTGLPATGTGLQGYSSFNAVNPTNSTDQQLQALNNYAALSAAG